MKNWLKEIDKLLLFNDNKIDENLINYVNNNFLIEKFYNKQNDVEKVVNDCVYMLYFVKNPTYFLYKMAIKHFKISSYRYTNSYKYAIFNCINIDFLTHNQYFDICLSLLEHYQSLKYIKIHKLLTIQYLELCMLCIDTIENFGGFYNYEFINFEYLNNYLPIHDIYKIFVTTNGLALQFIKEQTEEICLLAVKNNHISFQYVKNKTFDICKIVLNKYGLFLKGLNKNNYTKEQYHELCNIAINNRCSSLEYVDEEFKTFDICSLAISICYNTIEFIKNPSEELCLFALEQNINSVHNIKIKSFNACKYIAKTEYTNLQFVTKKNMIMFNVEQLIELYDIIVNKETNIIKSPLNKLYTNLFKKSILENFNHKPSKLCYHAVKHNYKELEHVIRQPVELCKYAITLNPKAIDFIHKKKLKKTIMYYFKFDDFQVIIHHHYKIPKYISELIGNYLVR